MYPSLAPRRTYEREALREQLSRKSIETFPSYVFRGKAPERKFQAFGVGLPRSGTHSLAYIFETNHRAAHEPWGNRTIRWIIENREGRLSAPVFGDLLAARDRRLALEFESNCILFEVTRELLDMFPRAKFVLTVREPLPWLTSLVNHLVLARGHTAAAIWIHFVIGRHGRTFAKEDAALAALEVVPPVRSLLTYWATHVRHVLETVPAERLLVLKTEELGGRVEKLARFVGVDSASLDLGKIHSGRWPDSRGAVLDELVPASYSAELANELCLDLVHDIFGAGSAAES